MPSSPAQRPAALAALQRVGQWIQALAQRALRALRADPARNAALAAIVMFIGLAMLHAVSVPPLKPIDERSHFSYALELRDGNLPEIETPVREDIVGLSRRKPRNTVWVANHPPLFYAMQAAVIGEVETKADLAEAFLRGRMLSVAITALGLWFVFSCARELCRPESKLPVLVVAMTASIPQFTHVMAMIHNDTLAFLTTTVALYFAIITLERGFSARRYLGLLMFTALCVATRVSGLMTAVATLTALAIAGYRHASGGWLRKSAFGAATVSGVALAIVASSGWFYLRNIELYGDISGAELLFEKFHRRPHGPVLELLGKKKLWWNFIQQLWGYFTGNIKVRSTTLFIPKYVGLVALLGLAADVFVRVRAITRARLREIVFEARTLNLAMLTCLSALTFLSIFVFHSGGGNAHVRYVFPLLWFLLAVPTIGLLRFGPRVAGFGLTILVLTHLLTLDAYIARVHRVQGSKVKDLLLVSFDRPEWLGSKWLVLMLVAVAAGLTMVLVYLGDQSKRADGSAEA